MSIEATTAKTLAELELMNEGRKLTSLTFGISLYTNRSFYDMPQALLQTFRAFLSRCPAVELTFYATETMNVHKPVTKRALGLLDSWMVPDAPDKFMLSLELKSSQSHEDAPTSKYEVWSDQDAPQQANVVSMSLPVALALSHADSLAAFVAELADIFPLRCGLAGYAMECSRYDKRKSEVHAWRMGLRYVGVDIIRLPYDAKAVGTHGIKGVGWLTLLGQDLVKELGGHKVIRDQLSNGVDLVACKHALILKAGAAPALGDLKQGETLPLYREIYRLLASRIGLAAVNSMVFSGLTGDKVELTKDWYTRLEC